MDVSTQIGEVLPHCPCCGAEGALLSFELAHQVTGELTRIASCASCHVLANLDSYVALAGADAAAVQSTDYYDIIGLHPADHAGAIANSEQNLIAYLLDRVALDPAASVFCEIGIGRGYTAIAAAQKFRSVYGLDLDLRPAQAVCDEVGQPENLILGGSLDEVDRPIDVLVAWHALEHIPEPLAFLRAVRPRMNPRGTFFFQVPLYRPSYLVRPHYLFFNEIAMRRLLELLGMAIVELGYDIEHGFLTVIARAED